MIHFDITTLIEEAAKQETLMASDSFWNDQKAALAIVNDLNEKRDKINAYQKLNSDYEELKETFDLLKETYDQELHEFLASTLMELEKNIDAFETTILFSGPFDKENAILELHPGAGGTESQDWAEMLYRMYIRFAEQKNFKVQMLDYQDGDEAGIKSVSFIIKGRNAYGLLKSEKGVHRLVRISPFDASGRRHTSFASVEVTPEIKDTGDIIVEEKDLKIDTYRSSGAGGQNVNKTESAVRITHLPTGIVVNCQNERSQIQNREIAMNILKSRLFQRQEQERLAELNKLRGEQKNIEWGSQIRSYVFCPYTMVKDHRTDYETGDVQSVLDGNIDGFINSYLKMEVGKNDQQ